MRQNIGGTDEEIVDNILKELQLDVSKDVLLKEVLDRTEEAIPKAPMKKGAERLLNHLHKTGVLFALATNSLRSHVMKHAAEKPKLFQKFHHWVCADDPGLIRGKPDPDPYLRAAFLFPGKPKPCKCLAFEDSVVGLQAAVAAGMQVVMTPATGILPKDTTKATLVLKSLQDFKPEDFGLPSFN